MFGELPHDADRGMCPILFLLGVDELSGVRHLPPGVFCELVRMLRCNSGVNILGFFHCHESFDILLPFPRDLILLRRKKFFRVIDSAGLVQPLGQLGVRLGCMAKGSAKITKWGIKTDERGGC